MVNLLSIHTMIHLKIYKNNSIQITNQSEKLYLNLKIINPLSWNSISFYVGKMNAAKKKGHFFLKSTHLLCSK